MRIVLALAAVFAVSPAWAVTACDAVRIQADALRKASVAEQPAFATALQRAEKEKTVCAPANLALINARIDAFNKVYTAAVETKLACKNSPADVKWADALTTAIERTRTDIAALRMALGRSCASGAKQ